MTVDEFMAKNIMNWTSGGDCWNILKGSKITRKKKKSFCPSKNIRDAFLVVERLEKSGQTVSINRQKDCWEVIFWIDYFDVKAEASNLPMAICLAAKKVQEYFDKLWG